uniref:isopentenyl-diphosphate Delta-isomerase n=4 Tax=Meloidogyne TaxID=189290 RepID=A0A915PCV6_9BILA
MSTAVSTDSVDPIQEQYLTENCIQVDRNDGIIGPVSKRECHMNPLLHRAFSVFIFDKERRMLLQKRSSTKITFPLVWTNSCCSHPLFGIEQNGVDGVKIAAKRKLLHELGIDTVNVGDMEVMGRFIYLARSDSIWVEHELDYAIIVTNFDATFKPNPEEVSEVRFVTPDELSEMFIGGKELFSPWFSLFYKFHWLKTWWEKLDDLKSVRESDDMHSIWSRGNTIFAFTLTVLSAVTLMAFLTSMFAVKSVKVEISAANPRIRSMSDYTNEEGKSDLAMVSLNIHADMSPIFNWNVKQLFIFLVAEYSTMKNVINQVVLWDKIVKRPDSQVILEESIHPKYYFLDDGSNLLSHQNVTLILKWNIVPNAGRLEDSQGDGQFILKFPSNYVSGRF